MKKIYQKLFRKRDEKSTPVASNQYIDFSEFEKEMVQYTKPFTMTSPERIKALINAIGFILENRIEGDFVECGVWKGGSAMVMAKTLLKEREVRKIWLYDTFEGMNEPTNMDMDPLGRSAKERLEKEDKFSSNVWAYSELEEVKANFFKTGYSSDFVEFVKGKVEKTLMDKNLPSKIALLRLDTDWYESTKTELEKLFPRVVKGGFVIIDDYGHWTGCKKAVDEYIKNNNLKVFLNRIDYTGRLIIKN